MNQRINDDIVSAIEEVVMLTRHLVDSPDDVRVEIDRKGYNLIVLLYTHPSDVGQVIGRNAHIIAAFRSLIAAISGKNNIRVVFDYVTEGDNKRAESSDRFRKHG